MDMSIIVTAHNEGVLAHKTMLSIFRAAKKLEDNNLKYEILVNIDNGTEETERYFSRYEYDDRVKIFKNSFGDPALARNFLLSKSSGDIISNIDADDLWSEGWLIDGYNKIKNNENLVLHFEYILSFGRSGIVVTDNSENLDGNELIKDLIDSNRYGSSMMVHKSLFKKIPQRKNDKFYSFEDHQWILDSLTHGAVHETVDGSVYFYRKDFLTKESVLVAHSSSSSVLSRTDILSLDSLKVINASTRGIDSINNSDYIWLDKVKSRAKKRLYDALVYANTFKSYRKIKNIRGGRVEKNNIPDSLVREWRNINSIEKQLFPSEYLIDSITFWQPNRGIGESFVRFSKEFASGVDTLMFVPWLIKGGADKVFINTINEVSENHKDWGIGVVQTVGKDSVWRHKLSENITYANWADCFAAISHDDQIRMLAMFVVQNNIKRIIIGNSKLAYDFVLKYKKLIVDLGVTVYAFAFCEVIGTDGKISDYIHEELPLIQDAVYKIITDNSGIAGQLEGEHAIPKDKVNTHHQFLDNEFIKPAIRNNDKLNVIWASRVSDQKVPWVLIDIGKKMEGRISIDAYGNLEGGYDINFFKDSGVNYKGSFNGIDNLPVEKYDAFIYTSSSDGMPNIILEMASKGLPIIAPNVGGIGDLIIDGETGILIEDYRDIDAYVEAIVKLSNDRNFRLQVAKNAQKLLRDRFNYDNWKKKVKEIFDK